MVEQLDAAEAGRLGAAPLTYPDVGATAAVPLPPGYRHQRLSSHVGHGRAVFEAAADALLGWRVQEGAGLCVRASAPRVAPGVVAEMRLRLVGPVRLLVPVRVVTVVEEPDRRGFAYGTLPGHPERGEESFVVSIDAEGRVGFELVAFSRPGRWFTRLGSPFAHALQVIISERYASAVRAAGVGG